MKIFGIVNVTPDSFSDGGHFSQADAAIAHGLKLAGQGADILDIGGESTRPGAADVSLGEELDRVVPVIEGLADRTDAQISIDTRKPQVAQAAVNAGASIWNDVTALRYSSDSLSIAAELGCRVVLMHMQGEPSSMQQKPDYQCVVSEVYQFLDERIAAARAAGVAADRVIADPGIGFGKTLDHNLMIFGALERFRDLAVPLLMGASRKRFIAGLDQDAATDERLGGSLAAAMRAQAAGWDFVRVHDVKQTRQALKVADAIKRSSS